MSRPVKPSKATAPVADPMFDAAPVVVEKPARPKRAAGPAQPKRERGPSVAYAALFEAASRGDLPPAPDLSKPTHAAFRKRGAALVAMAEAGDIEGLKADNMEPKSSSRAILCRYRDLAIVALAARSRRP